MTFPVKKLAQKAFRQLLPTRILISTMPAPRQTRYARRSIQPTPLASSRYFALPLEPSAFTMAMPPRCASYVLRLRETTMLAISSTRDFLQRAGRRGNEGRRA